MTHERLLEALEIATASPPPLAGERTQAAPSSHNFSKSGLPRAHLWPTSPSRCLTVRGQRAYLFLHVRCSGCHASPHSRTSLAGRAFVRARHALLSRVIGCIARVCGHAAD